jgi:TrmH family RNA methyltransferase
MTGFHPVYEIKETQFDLTFVCKRNPMLLKSQVKYIQSLGQKKFRDQEGVFIVEGPKMVKELLDAPNTALRHLYAVKEWLEDSREWLPPAISPHITELKAGELERISSLSTPNQVLAVLEKPSFPPPAFENTVSLLLDGIQDPGNLGTIVRIADWFGLRQVVCSRDCADIFNGKAIQSTMGSISRVQVVYDDPEEVIRLHPDLPVYAAVLEGRPLYETGHISKGLVMIGNESRGLRGELLELATHRITIPRKGQAESLNAAVATGIILSYLV